MRDAKLSLFYTGENLHNTYCLVGWLVVIIYINCNEWPYRRNTGVVSSSTILNCKYYYLLLQDQIKFSNVLCVFKVVCGQFAMQQVCGNTFYFFSCWLISLIHSFYLPTFFLLCALTTTVTRTFFLLLVISMMTYKI